MPGSKRRGFQRPKDEISVAARRPNVALYVRVSTEEQAQQGFSLDGQIEKGRSFCTSKDWIVADVYREEGASGRDTKRPEYQRMLSELEKWDTILVLKMDRIHRNSRNFIEMMDFLEKKGKGFASVQDNLDTKTAMGRFVGGIIQAIAQLESEQIGERTHLGMSAKIRVSNGSTTPLGQARPFGYWWLCSVPHGECKGKQLHDHAVQGSSLVPDREESQIVKRIYRFAAKGGSVRKISLDLDWCKCTPKVEARRYALKDGTIKIWKGTTFRSDCAGCSRVRYILTNPVYLGYFVWGERIHEGTHEALIDRKTFEGYNRRRAVPVVLPELKK